MEMNNLIDILLGLVLVGGGWWAKECHSELKRVQILLNKTREEYATKMELRDDMNRMMEVIRRIEDKLDRLITN